ncbi:glycosyltransferase [Vibrio aquaticus]|uniref:Glycosyltransferase n=1 Tax=Vibrio aquaticus TaxID=2496559 RepID=A0A3S0Q2P5_9VIBR|nr:glycosyltransferase [Vibrio aquaticus]RTZ16804.1 glycosyltransferase [Vibrio aquaticus]
MAKINKTLVFDPIPFKGGSKIATSDALTCSSTQLHQFVVLSVTPDYWESTDFYAKHDVSVIRLFHSGWLIKHHNGPLYWLNQLTLLVQLFFVLCLQGKITKIVGASGPGIDMPLYLAKRLFSFELIQMIHGNVGCSRSIGYCLTNADSVFYLPSARPSMKTALITYLSSLNNIADTEHIAECYLKSANYQSFVNGIPEHRWPTQSEQSLPIFFWSASLLKWKGLDLFIQAARIASTFKPLAMNICFIRPKQTCLPISEAPINLNRHTQWYDDPSNLDEIRANSNIFVSTSVNEPFGLSILEALAAGMCVILPQDGAFWDQQLEHNVNCIKYQPNDPESLSNALLLAAHDPLLCQLCQTHALDIAKQFKAEYRYMKFAQCLNGAGVTHLVSSLDHS